jgi:hypothetical protein
MCLQACRCTYSGRAQKAFWRDRRHLQNNLLEDRHLSMSRPADTMYKLKMCGVDGQEARPSILICHPLLDKKVGRLILKRLSVRNLQDQYQCCRDDTRPGFEIYLYLSSEFQVLGNSSKSLSICTCKDSKVAQIVSNDKSCPVSTIACGVFFPGDSTVFASHLRMPSRTAAMRKLRD